MQITFDPAKDQINRDKHGISLADAAFLEWGALFAVPDDRKNYGESRMVGYAPIGQRLYCVIYTDRERVRRVINLRKANTRESRYYAEHN